MEIPDVLDGYSISSIGDKAFSGCGSLMSITVPDGVRSIGCGAFENAISLSSIQLPDSLQDLGAFAFFGCSSLQAITIPEGVQQLQHSTFMGCTGLISISLPQRLESVGVGCFTGCSALTDVYYAGTQGQWYQIYFGNGNSFPESATIHFASVPETDISGTWGNLNWTLDSNGLLTISGSGAMENLQYTSAWGQYRDQITEVVINNGVTSIGELAFYDCTSLTGVTIPDSVTSIGGIAFANCTSLNDAYYTGTEAQWASVTIGSDNELLTGATIHFNWVEGGTLVLPAGLTTIESEAFVNLPGIRTVYIPATVTWIADDAFDEEITIRAPGESYALYWAQYHNFAYIED